MITNIGRIRQSETEYFILFSYSCLLTVVKKLEDLNLAGESAVLFCFTTPIYQFLALLNEKSWIEVVKIEIDSVAKVRGHHPGSVLSARRDMRRLYNEYFAQIPGGSRVHFFNRLQSRFPGYIVWKLKDRCEVHYAECDPIEYYKPIWNLRAIRDWILWKLAYSMPVKLVGEKYLPLLTKSYLDKAVDVLYECTKKSSEVTDSHLFQGLRKASNAKVLWVMGNYLTFGRVEEKEYLSILKRCADIVTERYNICQQAVKFHPFSRQREDIWPGNVACVPAYVPSQFLELPDLEWVIALSSTALIPEVLTSHIQVISLINMLPFRNKVSQERFEELYDSNMGNEYMAPTSLYEFRNYFFNGGG